MHGNAVMWNTWGPSRDELFFVEFAVARVAYVLRHCRFMELVGR
jgi:hypothetical protein